MALTAEDFRQHYESLSDDALLEIHADELTAVAGECLAAEMERRGLLEAEPEPAADAAATEVDPDAAVEELTCVAEYDYPDEADLARGLLEAAEIPATVDHEPNNWKLMVPAEFANQALQMLVTPLTDEELAAQAEAAGWEDEPDEEDADEEAEEPAE